MKEAPYKTPALLPRLLCPSTASPVATTSCPKVAALLAAIPVDQRQPLWSAGTATPANSSNP